jgi:hypothetical protein
VRQLLRFKIQGHSGKRRKAVVCDAAVVQRIARASLAVRAQARGFPYFETSASSGQNVKEAFDSLFQRVLEKVEAQRK